MARGLSDEDIAALRQQVANGKRPRVQLSGPHFEAGATGTVLSVGQPDTDGPDYLRVRVKVDNMTDELAFGPAELKLPGRATKKTTGRAPARKAAVAKAAAVKPAVAKAAAVKAAGSIPPGEPLIAPPTKANPAKTAPAKAVGAKAAPIKAPATNAVPTKAPATDAAPTKPVRRKAGPAQKVAFTVASAGASWSLTATRGSKNVVKSVPLPPGVVGALAELLDQPALSDAIGEINNAALAEAQARAEQLRAELSQLEAVLATHTRP